MSEGRTIQLKGIHEKKREFWEGRRITISNLTTTILNIPSKNGRLTFYPTGRFAEPDVEIWSLRTDL